MLNTPSVMSSVALRRAAAPRRSARAAAASPVREHLDRGAAQAGAVDDAGVIQLVRDDDVVAAEERRRPCRRWR